MDDVDSLIGTLFNNKVLTPSINKSEVEYKENKKYQFPVKIGKAGKPLDGDEKPWLIGGFFPGKYLNETHPTGHNGIDIKAPKGTPIYPTAPGKVIETNIYPKGGKTCKVAHEDGSIVSYYAHMDSVNVQNGQEVDLNTKIGSVGSTGNARGVDHLHFEIKVNGTVRDPISIINNVVIGTLSNKISNSLLLLSEFFKK